MSHVRRPTTNTILVRAQLNPLQDDQEGKDRDPCDQVEHRVLPLLPLQHGRARKVRHPVRARAGAPPRRRSEEKELGCLTPARVQQRSEQVFTERFRVRNPMAAKSAHTDELRLQSAAALASSSFPPRALGSRSEPSGTHLSSANAATPSLGLIFGPPPAHAERTACASLATRLQGNFRSHRWVSSPSLTTPLARAEPLPSRACSALRGEDPLKRNDVVQAQIRLPVLVPLAAARPADHRRFHTYFRSRHAPPPAGNAVAGFFVVPAALLACTACECPGSWRVVSATASCPPVAPSG